MDRRRGAWTRSTAAAGGLTGACLILSACANILGLQDRRVDEGDASTSSATTATTSQSSARTSSASTSSTTGGTIDAGIEDAGIDDAARDAREKGQSDATVDDAGDAEVPEASLVCPDSGACVLASGLNHPWTIAVDEQRVYWTEAGTNLTTPDGSVKSCPLAGCGAGGPTIYASNLNFPRDIAIDSTYVYWETTSSTTPGGIWRCPLAGCSGAPTQLAIAAQPYGMALDATYVYWVDQLDNSVHRSPKAGGGTTQVLDDGGGGVHSVPQRAAVDNAFVYFLDDFGRAVAVPFDAGAPRIIQTNDGTNTDYAILVDSTSIYYGASNFTLAANYPNSDFFFRSDKKANNAAQVALVPNVDWAYALALDSDAGRLYFGDFGDDFSASDALGRVAIDGGGLVYFGQNLAPIEWVAVNSTYLVYAVYSADFNWAPNSGSIVRTAK